MPKKYTGQINGRLQIIELQDATQGIRYDTLKCTGCHYIKKDTCKEWSKGIFKSCNCQDTGNPHKEIYAGQTFGKLTTINFSHVEKRNGKGYWNCKCECGNTVQVMTKYLNNGDTKSCGCLAQFLTDKNSSINVPKRIYFIWYNMVRRCTVPSEEFYYLYGGRGILVCKNWLNVYKFYEWVLTTNYSDDLTIERIDVNGDYEPSNCTFIPIKEQCYNKQNTVYITAFGENKALCYWLKDSRCNTTEASLRGRIKRGWSPETAISTPPHGK